MRRLTGRKIRWISRYSTRNPQIWQGSSYNSAREVQKQACGFRRSALRSFIVVGWWIDRYASEPTKTVILQNKSALPQSQHGSQLQTWKKENATEVVILLKLLKHIITLWFVFKLSICFLNSSCQKSLHINLIASRWSLNRGRSIVYLFKDE